MIAPPSYLYEVSSARAPEGFHTVVSRRSRKGRFFGSGGVLVGLYLVSKNEKKKEKKEKEKKEKNKKKGGKKGIESKI